MSKKMPKVLLGYSGRRLPAGKEEMEEKDNNEESRIRNGIAQKVIEGIKERASGHEDAESLRKEQSGNVPSKAGTARKLKMKKRRRKTGKRRTRWT